MIFFTVRWESWAGIWTRMRWGSRWTEKTVLVKEASPVILARSTCSSPVNEKQRRRGRERVEIKDEGVLVQRGWFRFVPNKGIKPQGEIISEQWGHSPTTPCGRQLGPIRKRRPLTAVSEPRAMPRQQATGGEWTGRRRSEEESDWFPVSAR